MVAWVRPLKGNLQDVIRFLASAPPRRPGHLNLYRLKQCGLAESHSAAIGRLLSDLLPNVTEVRYDTGELSILRPVPLRAGQTARTCGELPPRCCVWGSWMASGCAVWRTRHLTAPSDFKNPPEDPSQTRVHISRDGGALRLSWLGVWDALWNWLVTAA